MEPGSPMSRETLLRLDDTGLRVRDVEFLTLGPDTGPADWRPALDAGAALGAGTLSVVGADPDRRRLTDTLAALTADAAALGIRPTLEPISYQPVRTVTEAAAIATAAGAAVLLDALHIQRGGSSVDDVRALTPHLVPCLQLCDGPLAAPEHLDLPDRLPLGMKADGSVLQAEARVQRRLIGDGELPLAELIAAAPAGIPLSIEVPHAALQARLTPLEYARLNLRNLKDVLATVNAHA
jgi:sugar phosphate isomerase/epimerase